MELLTADKATLVSSGKHPRYRLSNGMSFVMSKNHGTADWHAAENELSMLKKMLGGKKPWER